MAQKTETDEDSRPLGELLHELTTEVAILVRQEVRLAKTEVGQKLALAGRDAGLIAAGAAGAYGGVLALLAALTLRLAGAEGRWTRSALLVGLLTTAGGSALAWKGLNGLRQADLAPQETLKTLKEDEQWLKEQVA